MERKNRSTERKKRSTAHLTHLRLTFARWEVDDMLHGEKMTDRFIKVGKLKPCVEEHRMTLFPKTLVFDCMRELEKGKLPPRIPEKCVSMPLPLPPEMAKAA